MDKAQLGFYCEFVLLVDWIDRHAQSGAWLVHSQSSEPSLFFQVDRLKRMLRTQSPAAGNVRFQPFGRTADLYDSFVEFAEQLAIHIEQRQTDSEGVRLGLELSRGLRERIDQLKEAFKDEVERQTVFLSPLRNRQYDSPEQFLSGETDLSLYKRLPRITRQQLEDAGKCLTYGMPGAAMSMALQAVESALRYYYRRHCAGAKTDWGPMLQDLKTGGHLPGKGDACFERLDRLRDQYRNAVAHGRAMFEQGKMEQGLERSGQTFDECLSAIRELYSEILTRPQLGMRIEISQSLSFDSLLATYLFYWNPELPDVTTDTFVLNLSLDSGQLVDSTWPAGQQLWSENENTSLSTQVLDKLQIQPSFKATIRVLTDFGHVCYVQRRVVKTGTNAPSDQQADLFDIVAGVCLTYRDDYVLKLTNAWSVFDQFLNSNLSASDRGLTSISNFRSYWHKLHESQ